MKKYLFVLAFFFLISCQDSNTPSPLGGAWEFRSVISGFTPELKFPAGEYRWTFNIHQGQLIIENNISDSNLKGFFPFETGTYQVEFGEDYIQIPDLNYAFTYAFNSDGTLSLGWRYALHGPNATLERVSSWPF